MCRAAGCLFVQPKLLRLDKEMGLGDDSVAKTSATTMAPNN
jgi:hypothetical protein